MVTHVIEEMERRASGGDAEALLALAQRHESDGAREKAAACLRRAVAQGNREAMTALARLLMADTLFDPAEAIRLVMEAARAGSGEAMHLFAMLGASGRMGPPSWPRVLDLVQRAAELGYSLAQSELALLAEDSARLEALGRGETLAPETWETLRRAVDLPSLLAAPSAHGVHSNPRIGTAARIASPALCRWLIERGRPHLKPAQIDDRDTGRAVYSHARTNDWVDLGFARTDVAAHLLRARIATLAGTADIAMEGIGILRYEAGQQFLPHYDFFDPDMLASAATTTAYRQRVLTVLIYLNEGYEGGETEFSTIGWRYKGNTGDALFFWNVNADGEPDRLTLHAGTAPKTGEKWLLSQWVRGRAA